MKIFEDNLTHARRSSKRLERIVSWEDNETRKDPNTNLSILVNSRQWIKVKDNQGKLTRLALLVLRGMQSPALRLG
jgi:hypothetical protein